MSALSEAILAAAGNVASTGSLVAYYPLEGATGNEDAGPHNLGALTKHGAVAYWPGY